MIRLGHRALPRIPEGRRTASVSSRLYHRFSMARMTTIRQQGGRYLGVRDPHLSLAAHVLHRGLGTAALSWSDAWLFSELADKRQRQDPPQEQPTATVLAHSAATTTTLSAPSHEIAQVLSDVAQRIHRFLQSLWDLLALSFRGAQVVCSLAPLAILTPAAVAIDPFVRQNRLSDAGWWYFTTSVQSLGPVFVKLCQWVATRPDIFPPHICDRLSFLHDKGLPHQWKHTDKMLREAFGDYEAAGLEIDPSRQVIGCGSAAQVYRASLVVRRSDQDDHRTTTRPVAVKVLHPNFSQLVDRDFWLMRTLADWLHALPVEMIRMLNLPRVASNFGTLLQAQSDLRVEANHLRTFRQNFYGRADQEDEHSSITFPRPVQDWTSTNVLVEDLVHDARPISDFLKDDSEEGRAIRKELAGPLLRAFLKMVFVDNFTHGDLHPGNVFIRTKQVPMTTRRPWSNTNWWNVLASNQSVAADREQEETVTKRTIVFLDAGIATSLSAADQRNLLDLFRAVILNQGEQAGRLMVERAKYERCSQTPGGVDAFSKGIGELVAEFHDNRKEGLTLGAVRIGSLLSRVLDLCRIHGVEIDPAMASIVVSTLVLEGLGRSLEPSLNLIDFAVPFVLGRGRV